MSVLSMIDQTQLNPGFEVAQAPSSTLSDVFSAGMESQPRNFMFTAKSFYETREQDARDRRYKELTGRDIYDDVLAAQANPDQLKYNRRRSLFPGNAGFSPEMKAATDLYIENLKTQDPDRFKGIFTSSEIGEEVKRKARESMAKSEKVAAGASGFASFTGSLAAGVATSFMDPLNLATIPLGAGISAGILKTMLIEGGINVTAEVLAHPVVADWQRQLGHEYGLPQLAENMGTAAVFGAGVSGLMKGVPLAYSKSRSLMFGEMRDRYREELNYEAERAAAYQSRHAHIDESNPAKAPPIEPPVDDITVQRFRRTHEDQIVARFEAPEAGAQYAAIDETAGGKILDTDIARKLIPEYRDNPAAFVDLTHGPASNFIWKQFVERLKKKPESYVILNGGGPGSGKSTLKYLNANHYAGAELIYDGTLSRFDDAVERIEMILESGRRAEINFVYADFAAALDRVAKRFDEEGRYIPAQAMAEAHFGAVETINKLADKYKGDSRVAINVFDNSGELPKTVPLENLAGLRYIDGVEALKAKAKERLKNVDQEVTRRTSDAQRSFAREDGGNAPEGGRSQTQGRRGDEKSQARLVQGTESSLSSRHQQALAEVDAALNEGRPLNPDNIPFSDEEILSLDRSRMEPGVAGAHERITEPPRFAPSSDDGSLKRINEAGERVYHADDLAHLRSQIDAGEAGRRGHAPADPNAPGNEGRAYSTPSTFPSYFRGKGYTKEAALKAIDNYLAGKKLTAGQAAMLEDLHDGMVRELRSEITSMRPPDPPTLERQRQLTEFYESPEWANAERAEFDEQFPVGDERIFMEDEAGDMSVDEMRKFFDDEESYLNSISSCGLGGSGDV